MNMYFIALVAPGNINEDVLKWKNFFHDRFGCTVALKSPAHIDPTFLDEGRIRS